MLGAKHFLADRQRALMERPRRREVALDVQQDLGSFEIRGKIDNEDDAVKVIAGNLETSIYFVRKTSSYADRFSHFAAVHKKFTGRDYDLTDPGKQVCVVASEPHRLQFLVRKSGGSSATIITKSFRSRQAFAIRRDEYNPLA